MYAKSYDHTKWDEHKVRIKRSTDIIFDRLSAAFVQDSIQSAADLSCGDGALLKSLPASIKKLYGDMVPRNGLQFVGEIEHTIHAIPPVDLFLLTESIEHLREPQQVLNHIRDVTQWLFLTTPTGEIPGTNNPEHIWEWDVEGMGEMLEKAGFRGTCDIIECEHYTYQAWTVR